MSMPSLCSEDSQISRKIYFVKKKTIKQDRINRHNFFKMTSGTDLTQSQASFSESRRISTTLQTSPSREAIQDPQKQLYLPIITQSKYNFRPSVGHSYARMQSVHPNEPKYKKDEDTVNYRNIKRLKALQGLWKKNIELRKGKSILQKSHQKAEKYVEIHNKDVKIRRKNIPFEELLRNKYTEPQHKEKEKGIPKKDIKGLKGQGGSVKSLFQELYSVQQVYKVHK